MVAVLRYLGLELRPAFVDRPLVKCDQEEAPALIEAKRVEVVVGRDNRQMTASFAPRDFLDSREHPGASSEPLGINVQGQDLAPVGIDDVGEKTRDASIVVGHESRVIEGIEKLAEPSHSPQLVAGDERF